MTAPNSLPWLVVACMTASFACSSPSPTPTFTDAPTSVEIERGTQPSTQPVSAPGATPMAQLNALDPRQPVPLQPMMAWHQKQNMMEHLVAIQRVTAGLAEENWEEVEAAAGLLGSSPEMEQMCTHMGAGAEGFTELALEFHRRADAIGVAARAHDSPAVLRATSNTLQACTSCHAAYRQDIVDAATWEARAGHGPDSAPSSSPGH
jgi:hypothetical protein